jgi:hypothetical protein
MPWKGFEPTIPASERAKTVHALDPSATVTGHFMWYLTIFRIVGLFWRRRKPRLDSVSHMQPACFRLGPLNFVVCSRTPYVIIRWGIASFRFYKSVGSRWILRKCSLVGIVLRMTLNRVERASELTRIIHNDNWVMFLWVVTVPVTWQHSNMQGTRIGKASPLVDYTSTVRHLGTGNICTRPLVGLHLV